MRELLDRRNSPPHAILKSRKGEIGRVVMRRIFEFAPNDLKYITLESSAESEESGINENNKFK